MPLDRQVIGSAAFAAIVLSSAQAFAASDPTGVWVNDTGRGAVEIKQCGEGLCGHVVWVKDPTDTKGCGRQIIGDATPVGSGTWDNGWIYSPERKKKYDVELKPLADGNLRVTGYAGTKLFSKKMIWTPAPADLVRCGEQQAAAAPAATPTETGNPSTAPVKAATIEELKLRAKMAPVEPKTAAAAPAAKATTPAPAADPKAAPAAKPATPAPATPEQEVAEEDSGSEGGLADKLGEFIQKGPDGKCKLDLPWVKVDFKCDALAGKE